jgi:hypothetical protein
MYKSILLALSLGAGVTPVHAAPAPKAPPAPIVKVVGRTATIALAYRTADKLIWVSSTRVAEAAPFMFQALQVKPHGAADGSDLAIFTYKADRAGTARLSFGLVPPGKMLVGLPMLVYKGPVARRVTVQVTAR